ncbi:MAG: GNAT family N-acetyltransferase [Ardenticatenaceae bacterium]
MQTLERVLPVAELDGFWSQELGCAPDDLRAGDVRLVPCGQWQIQVLATPDGAVVIGLPQLIACAQGATTAQLLDPQFWTAQLKAPRQRITFYGPGSLCYVSARTFEPHSHAFVRMLKRRDAGEVARFARILQAREPEIFHAWAIGGRVTANERLWGAYHEGKIVSMAGLRRVNKNLCEVGVNTLPHQRRKGWGTAVASAATKGGLTLTPLVQWSAPLHNEPSQRIAQRLGFQPYAHHLWLSFPSDLLSELGN